MQLEEGLCISRRVGYSWLKTLCTSVALSWMLQAYDQTQLFPTQFQTRVVSFNLTKPTPGPAHGTSNIMRTLDTNQRTKAQTCRVLSIYIPRPADVDSHQLQQTWCEQKLFLTSSYQIQPAPSSTKWIGKQQIRVQLNNIAKASYNEYNELAESV